MASGIYCIRNIINGKVYIGSAINLNKRKYEHFNTSRLSNPHLQNAMKKHGKENFEFHILEYVDNVKTLIPYEQFWIDNLRKKGIILYNIALRAGSSLGIKRSNETKLKMSKSKIGHLVSEEQRKKSRQRALGNKYNLGKKRTPEQIENIRKSHIGQIVPEWVRQKSLKVRLSKPYWNAGLTKKIDLRIKRMSDSRKGQPTWNKDLWKKKISLEELKNYYLSDKTISECAKKFSLSVWSIRIALKSIGIIRNKSVALVLAHKRRK